MNRQITFRSVLKAEIAKIWAFRLTLYGYGLTVIFTSLVAYELFLGEHLSSHVQLTSWLSLLPYIYWASWGKLWILQLFYMLFSVYCVSVEPQYGMAKVLWSQPYPRFGIAAAKYVAILTHVASIALFYCFVLVLWSGFAAGWRGIGWGSVASLFLFSFRLIVYSVAFAWLTAAASMLRTSMLGAISSVFLVMMVIGLLNFLPGTGLHPYLFFRYFMYAIEPVRMATLPGDLPNLRESTSHFLVACFSIPTLLSAVSVARLSFRDVLE